MTATTTAITWESLRYAGDRRYLAYWYGLHPLTKRTVEVSYDKITGQTRSKPRCPELEAVARTATLVRERHAAVRRLRLDPAALDDLAARAEADLAKDPGDEAATVLLHAVRLEQKKRRLLGPAIDEARRTGGDVKGLVAADLWGFSDGGC